MNIIWIENYLKKFYLIWQSSQMQVIGDKECGRKNLIIQLNYYNLIEVNIINIHATKLLLMWSVFINK